MVLQVDMPFAHRPPAERPCTANTHFKVVVVGTAVQLQQETTKMLHTNARGKPFALNNKKNYRESA